MSGGQKKIVIVFLIDFLATREGVTGGTEKQLIEKIKRIDKTRFRPILFCLQEFVSVKLWDEVTSEKKMLHVYSFKTLRTIRELWSLIFFLRKNKVSVLEAVFFDSIFFGVIVGKLAGVKRIVSCRRDMGFWYSASLLKKLSFLNRLTDKILVNSAIVQKNVARIENIHLDKVDVIYNGIDVKEVDAASVCDLLSKFHQIQSNDRIVGMVANFNRKIKRVDLFVRALAVVLTHVENVKFLVIGDGKLRDELKELAKDIGVDNSLIWAGRKENPLPYVKSFTMGVLTSDSEGLSNSILEYMAAGLPVVATDTGGNPELIDDGRSGFLVPVNDHHALAEKISCLLADEQLALSMGKRGRRIVEEKYSWDKKIQEYEVYYQNLIRPIS